MAKIKLSIMRCGFKAAAYAKKYLKQQINYPQTDLELSMMFPTKEQFRFSETKISCK